MKNLIRHAVILTLFCILIMTLSGCSHELRYSVDQFSNDMKNIGYSFEVLDAQKDFLPTERKRLAFDDEDIFVSVYVYKNNEAMEKDAINIDIGGSSYNTENRGVNVSWVSFPHFFKKGNIIVQYIGENESFVADLTDILGDEFAGYGKIQALETSSPG